MESQGCRLPRRIYCCVIRLARCQSSRSARSSGTITKSERVSTPTLVASSSTLVATPHSRTSGAGGIGGGGGRSTSVAMMGVGSTQTRSSGTATVSIKRHSTKNSAPLPSVIDYEQGIPLPGTTTTMISKTSRSGAGGSRLSGGGGLGRISGVSMSGRGGGVSGAGRAGNGSTGGARSSSTATRSKRMSHTRENSKSNTHTMTMTSSPTPSDYLSKWEQWFLTYRTSYGSLNYIGPRLAIIVLVILIGLTPLYIVPIFLKNDKASRQFIGVVSLVQTACYALPIIGFVLIAILDGSIEGDRLYVKRMFLARISVYLL